MEYKKVALVTGASGGIGAQIAKKLSESGYEIILHGRNLEKLEKIKKEIGNGQIVLGDLSDYEACQDVVTKSMELSGGIDVLVNNIGITKDNLIIKMSPKDFIQVMETNLNSAFYLSKLLCKSMIKKKSGRIINITSISGIHGNAGQTNYSASKAAMIGFTKALAKELASKNILVNAIAPGFIETEMTENLSDETKKQIFDKIPLKRFGRAEDVANVVDFLASEKSNYITGQVITVDGGICI